MAFPVVGTIINNDLSLDNPRNNADDATRINQIKQRLRQRDQLQKMRQFLLNRLFPKQTVSDSEPVAQQLAQIAQILGRSAGNEPTIYDNGSFRSSASGNANALTQQVERALTQVLGRTPGRGYDGFVNALNCAFPTDAYGKVMTTPSKSVVSLAGNGNYSNVGDGFYSPASLGNYPAAGSGYASAPTNSAGVGQLSVEQANLYRQASINAADALRVLEALQPFDPIADIDAVEALRGLIRSQINTLVEEFGRIDEPRRERVEPYLDTLDGSIKQLGEQARLVDRIDATTEVFPVTLSDETQVAGFELLRNYANTLRDIFEQFRNTNAVETTVTGRYSERLSRSYIMLPVLADSNTSFMAAMDSIGFTTSERRSDAALFSILGTPRAGAEPRNETTINLPFFSTSDPELDLDKFNLLLPDITVNDFNEWVERFATIEAPSILSASGQFGLDFVTDQADTLFWMIGTVLSEIKRVDSAKSSLLLDKVLSFERVQQTLSEFLFQLDTLADLGVGSTADPTVNIISQVSGDNQQAQSNNPLLKPLVVLVTNGGSPVSGVPLTFTVNPLNGGSISSSTLPIVTGDAGQATVFWTLGSNLGPNTVQVSGTGLKPITLPVTFTATATNFPVNLLAKVIDVPSNGLPGDSFPLVVKVTSGDSPISGVSLTVKVTSGEGRVSADSIVTNVQGQASVNWTLGSTRGVNKVKVSGTGLDPVTFTINTSSSDIA
jgi:hypothetical protein